MNINYIKQHCTDLSHDDTIRKKYYRKRFNSLFYIMLGVLFIGVVGMGVMAILSISHNKDYNLIGISCLLPAAFWGVICLHQYAKYDLIIINRLVAYQNLQLDLNDLVICEPLNAELSITEVIAQMNICTTVWKKSDYMAAPAMMLKEANEVFDFAMFLHSKACPLSTISLWCFGRKSLQAKDLVECLNTKKLPEIFEDKTWFRSSIRWFKAAQGKFKDKFLMNRYLIDFITKQWKPDEDFEVFTAEMERKINDLTRDQADQIMNPHKTEGMAREQLIMDMLTQYLG